MFKQNPFAAQQQYQFFAHENVAALASEEIKSSLAEVNNLYTNYYEQQQKQQQQNEHATTNRSDDMYATSRTEAMQYMLQKMFKKFGQNKYMLFFVLGACSFMIKNRKYVRMVRKVATTLVILWIFKQVMKEQHVKMRHFNMIEILIAISIIVTFTGLAGTAYHKKFVESRIAFAKIELNLIQQALIMFHARTGQYPTYLEQVYESGDLNSRLKNDPWGTEYLYVPHVDWIRLIEILDKQKAKSSAFQEQELRYFIESVAQLAKLLAALPDYIDPVNIVAQSSASAFAISIGSQNAIFPSDISDNEEQQREKAKQAAVLIKAAREKATGNLALQTAVDQVGTQMLRKENPTS